MTKAISILILIFLAVYFGQAIKTQRALQLRLEDDLKQNRLTAPEFDERMRDIALLNILVQPSLVLKID